VLKISANRRSPDFVIFITVMMLVSIGIVMIFSSSSYYAMLPPYNNPYLFLFKQIISVLIGLFSMVFMIVFDYRKLRNLAPMLLGISIIFLLLVLTPLGDERLGAQRWIDLGVFDFQPSEFAKLCLIFFMAAGLSRKGLRIEKFKEGVLPYLLIVVSFSGLILAENDLGTAITLAGTSLVIFFCAGVRFFTLGSIIITGISLAGAAIFLEDYRRERFLSFLNPEGDPGGAGWQILNSLMSVGSGGFLGTGLGQGRHSKFLYLPERQTDFIFAAIGEELGFIGASLVILLFALFVWRGLKIAAAAPDSFSSLLAAGIVSGIALQAIINIGVVINLLPVTGITLPFVSYGGNSMIFSLLSVGLLLNISRSISTDKNI
jgi:cell division protein FtsW